MRLNGLGEGMKAVGVCVSRRVKGGVGVHTMLGVYLYEMERINKRHNKQTKRTNRGRL